MNTRITMYVDSQDWEYLGVLAEALGRNRSEIAREAISLLTRKLKKAMGENPTIGDADLSAYHQVMADFGRAPKPAAAPTSPPPKPLTPLPAKSPQVIPVVGRNEKCPCGSGRKYKYCHGQTQA